MNSIVTAFLGERQDGKFFLRFKLGLFRQPKCLLSDTKNKKRYLFEGV